MSEPTASSSTTSEPTTLSSVSDLATLGQSVSTTEQKRTLPAIVEEVYKGIKIEVQRNKKCNIIIYKAIEGILPDQVKDNQIIQPIQTDIDIDWFYQENEKTPNYVDTIKLMIRQYLYMYQKFDNKSVILTTIDGITDSMRKMIRTFLWRRLSALKEIDEHKYLKPFFGGKRFTKRNINKNSKKNKTKRNKRKTRKIKRKIKRTKRKTRK